MDGIKRQRALLKRAAAIIRTELDVAISSHRVPGQSRAEVLATRTGPDWVRAAHHEMRRWQKLLDDINAAIAPPSPSPDRTKA